MEKKELNNDSLEKVSGGITVSTQTDGDGNTVIEEFGVFGECVGCGVCANTCAVNAIRMEYDAPVIDGEACILCGSCAEACPMGALGYRTRIVPAA